MSKARLAQCKALVDAGKLQGAWEIAEDLLTAEPNKANPIILASYVCHKLGKSALAYNLALRATHVAPHESAAWTNLGVAAGIVVPGRGGVGVQDRVPARRR